MQPNEIFTFPKENTSQEAKNAAKTHFCRFLDSQCDKQSRTISYPMGVCSVHHSGQKAIICPHRFLENNLVFTQICQEIWGTIDNILLFSEVKAQNGTNISFG